MGFHIVPVFPDFIHAYFHGPFVISIPVLNERIRPGLGKNPAQGKYNQ
jgi:hypothetical protein